MPNAFDQISSGRSAVQIPAGGGTLQSNLYLSATASGTNPSATGSGVESVIGVASLSAGLFNDPGSGIYYMVQGSFASNGNQKRVRVWFNPTAAVVGSTISLGAGAVLIADTTLGSGASFTNAAFALSGYVIKTGTFGSNTQLAIHESAQVGSTTQTLLLPTAIAAIESGTILLAITGTATTSAADVTLNAVQVTGIN